MIQTELTGLIQRAREGDPQAREELISGIQDRVYYHCKKMMKHDSDAQDAAQDVLVTVLTSLDKLREPTAFYSWVNGITANRCRHLLTQGVREWQLPEDEDGGSMLDDLEDLDQQAVPEAVLDDKETQRLLMEIIDGLPPEQRMSVLFYYYDEMSVKEIAQAMEVSEGTVKSRLNYARKAIRAGVEDLEKRGTKLYGLAPVPLVLYLLRREAEALALPAEEGAHMTAGALSAAEGGTAGASAAGIAGASAAAGAAGGAAAKAGLALGTRIVLGLTAAALAGGAVFAGAALLNRPEEPEPTPEPSVLVEESEPQPTPTPSRYVPQPLPTPEPVESQGPSLDLPALLDSITYYGDKERSGLTQEQAAAFAEVIRQEMGSLEARARASADYDKGTTSYQAALFDAGDGTPVLFFGGGLSYEWKNQQIDRNRDSVGINGLWEYRDGRAVPFPLEDLDIDCALGRHLTLKDGYLIICGGDRTGSVYHWSVYALENGAISPTPVGATRMEHVPLQPETEVYYVNGVQVDYAEYDAWGDPWADLDTLCSCSWSRGIGGWYDGLGDAAAMADALEEYAAGAEK